ncbi:MAG: alpha/beta fold hydrolase, partial [Bacteroides sp.]|nr:alpha/beta fold hydrolase [Bacteroides sp.]
MIFWSDALLKLLMDAGFFVVRFDNRDTGLSTKIHSEKMLSRGKIFSMIAKNQVGIGNKKTEVPYTLHDMANDVLGLIDALGFDKVNLIGASMGGMISQIICATHPDKVDKLILIFSSSNRAFLRL